MVNYTEIEESLASAGATLGAAEAHGILCGAMCSGHEPRLQTWLEEVLDELDPEGAEVIDCRKSLEILLRDTAQALMGSQMDFFMLLPDDERTLSYCIDELGAWCQGFLYGFGTRSQQSIEELDESCQEFLRDLVEISRAEADPDTPDEMTNLGEQSLVEVVEYVRVGVMTLFEELSRGGAQTQPSSATLH